MGDMSNNEVYEGACGKSSMAAIVADDEHAPHEKSLKVVVNEVSRAKSRGRKDVHIEKVLVGEVGCENAGVISKHVEEGPEVADLEAYVWDGVAKRATANKGRIFALEGLPHEVFLD